MEIEIKWNRVVTITPTKIVKKTSLSEKFREKKSGALQSPFPPRSESDIFRLLHKTLEPFNSALIR